MRLATAAVVLVALVASVASVSAHRPQPLWKGGASVWHPTGEPAPSPSRFVQDASSRGPEQIQPLPVHPAVLHHGDLLTVHWKGLLQPQDGDWVAVYCPHHAHHSDFLDFRAVHPAQMLQQQQQQPDDLVRFMYSHGTLSTYQKEHLARRASGGEIDFALVGESNSSMVFGPLMNMRCQYQFRYFRGGIPTADQPHTATLLAQSKPVPFVKGPSEPLQGRLALTNNPDEMRVLWVSTTAGTPTVKFGTVPGVYDRSATGTSYTYTADDMCGRPANITSQIYFRDPGMIHDVLLTDLEVGRQRYYYVFGSDADGWSPEYSFRSALKPGDDGLASSSPQQLTKTSQSQPQPAMRVFVIADLGEWTDSTGGAGLPGRSLTTMSLIEKDLKTAEYDMLLHVGDISYARGAAYEWEQFGELIQPVATAIPYHIGVGNHEYDHLVGGESGKDPSGAPGQGFHPSWGNYGEDSHGECGVPTNARFHMPDNGNKVFWYSYDYGLAHFIFLSTEHDYSPNSPMHEWLRQDLAAVNRSVTPWVFVTGHRPMYCSRNAYDNYLIAAAQQDLYEDLLRSYGVDAFFSGHYHSYERTCPVYRGTCRGDTAVDARGTVHLMVGMAGASKDPETYYDKEWSLYRESSYGYSRLQIFNATHAYFEFVRNSDASVPDSTWIVSDHKWHLEPFVPPVDPTQGQP